MPVNPVDSPSALFAAAPTTTNGAGDVKKAAETKETFLNLLVAQLRYQDPTNPADSTQFMAQTAQFSALEAMQDVATKMQALIGTQMAFGSAALLGREVTYTNDAGTKVTGIVSSVENGTAGPMLTVGDDQVALSSITTVAQPRATGSTTSTT